MGGCRTHLPSAGGGGRVECSAWQIEPHGVLRGFVSRAPGEVWAGHSEFLSLPGGSRGGHSTQAG